MRILVTTFTYPPNKDGVAEASRVMAEGLAEHGWEVSVATGYPTDGSEASAFQPGAAGGVKVERFDLGHHNSEDPEMVQEVRRFLDFVLDGAFDVIVNQCWDVWPTTLMQPILSKLTSAKVLVSHGYSQHVYQWAATPAMGLGVWLRGLQWTFARLPKMAREYDRLIFLSEKQGWGRFFDHTVAIWLKHPGIEVVPNGTDPDLTLPDDGGFRTRHGIGPGPMALCVANYCLRKNQQLAVRVFREARVPGSTLVFIGSELNDYAREARELDEQLRGPAHCCQVVFLEKLTRAETFAAFKATDLVILTAKTETQPIVLIEAMAAGKPWISTDTGCVDRMEGGIVCRNAASMRAALINLLTDPELRTSLSVEGRKAARSRYSSSNCVMKYDSIFRSLVEH
ncbi:MAG: glycosyltransferase family 4 protein [Verrucomicrobiota bacterium]